jgi:RNA polymerase sigma factor (sigma-70 family)
MLRELSPVVHRQARRYCSDCPELVEDAYQEACIKLWELLEQGHRDRPYLLTATRNRIIDVYRREQRQPRRLEPSQTADGDEYDPWEDVAIQSDEIGELETRVFIGQYEGALRRALTKQVFSDEAMTGAERVALCRARGQLRDAFGSTLN